MALKKSNKQRSSEIKAQAIQDEKNARSTRNIFIGSLVFIVLIMVFL